MIDFDHQVISTNAKDDFFKEPLKVFGIVEPFDPDVIILNIDTELTQMTHECRIHKVTHNFNIDIKITDKFSAILRSILVQVIIYRFSKKMPKL